MPVTAKKEKSALNSEVENIYLIHVRTTIPKG